MVHYPIILGKDYNFFQKVRITSDIFLEVADVVINITNQSGLSLINEGATLIEYSFNGNTLHGDLTPNTPSQGVIFDQRRVTAIWFRSPDGGANKVRIEAWSGF